MGLNKPSPLYFKFDDTQIIFICPCFYFLIEIIQSVLGSQLPELGIKNVQSLYRIRQICFPIQSHFGRIMPIKEIERYLANQRPRGKHTIDTHGG
jgi:hypothetical protein